ncbi:MAG: YcxB-like protein [Clostridia bacterium]|nr:YcxB-like protein [Clostridia bacterium]
MEQGLSIEVEQTITYEIYKKYYFFCLFRGKIYKYFPILIYIISTLAIILSLFTGFSFGFVTMDFVLLGVLGVILLVMTFSLVYVPRKYYKTAKKMLETPAQYKFTEEYLYVEAHTETTSGHSQVKYEGLHKIYESQDMVYIFLSNNQAYILEKKNFNAEDFQKLRRILQDKLGKMYFKYSKDRGHSR